MKLRNKKTGEIVDCAVYCNGTFYHSVNDVFDEWEDYEEKGWYITENGEVRENRSVGIVEEESEYREIGNCFKTKEEAEKAVEKLKAWKRLKDKGFKFDLLPALGHCDDKKFDISIIGTMPAKWWYNDKVVDDIHYVFGGEE